MASNSFGNLFRITTWGESHGKAIGVVIDGCPAGLAISEEEINDELKVRQGGNNPYVTPRKENDQAEIYSGVFEGKTTGTPISLIIFNHNADSTAYESIKDLYRPGHANFTYLHKYGIFDPRGGGRASARETACRVAAGAIAKKLLKHYGITLTAYLSEIAHVACNSTLSQTALREAVLNNPIFCPDTAASEQMIALLEKAKEEGDSVGGIVEVITSSLPIGLGDPVYEKLEAKLAEALLSIPASKGFEVGTGFAAARMKGSAHNDGFTCDIQGQAMPASNTAGGVLGGISTGQPLIARVAFKPTSSIRKTQQTVNVQNEEQTFQLPLNARHDPCVAIRAVPVVEAMTAIVLADALLLHRCAKLSKEEFL